VRFSDHRGRSNSPPQRSSPSPGPTSPAAALLARMSSMPSPEGRGKNIDKIGETGWRALSSTHEEEGLLELLRSSWGGGESPGDMGNALLSKMLSPTQGTQQQNASPNQRRGPALRQEAQGFSTSVRECSPVSLTHNASPQQLTKSIGDYFEARRRIEAMGTQASG